MGMCGAGGMAVVQVAYGSPASLAYFLNGTVQVVQAAAPAPDSWLCTTEKGWWAQLGVVTIAGMAAQLLFLLAVEWLIEKATEVGGANWGHWGGANGPERMGSWGLHAVGAHS